MHMIKTGKYIIAASASVLLLTAGNSQASIQWDPLPYSLQPQYNTYNFQVQSNNGEFLDIATFDIEGYPLYVRATSNGNASSYGETVNRSLDTSFLTSILSMEAGAQGTGIPQSPSDGLSVKAYAEMIFTGFDDERYVILDSKQKVVASASRRLTVDSPGLYNFSADFLGDISYQGLKNTSIMATFNAYVYNGSDLTSLSDSSLSFNMLANPHQNEDMQLKVYDDNNKSIFYDVSITIYLESEFSNFDMEQSAPTEISFLDNGNGHLYAGTEANPLQLSCSLTPVAETHVPVPPAALLLFSGLSGLAIFRRKARG